MCEPLKGKKLYQDLKENYSLFEMYHRASVMGQNVETGNQNMQIPTHLCDFGRLGKLPLNPNKSSTFGNQIRIRCASADNHRYLMMSRNSKASSGGIQNRDRKFTTQPPSSTPVVHARGLSDPPWDNASMTTTSLIALFLQATSL